MAALYALLWVASVSLLFTIAASLERGELAIRYLTTYALQWTLFSGLMIYATIGAACYAMQIARRLREEEARAARFETLRARAELHALRAQLNPHFIFNTLHSVMGLVRRDARAAENAIEQLAGLLRYVLHGRIGPGAPWSRADDVRVGDELAFVDTNLSLEKLRLSERLRVDRRVAADALDHQIPAVTIQPLVENAVKHAVAPRAGGGTLPIDGERGPGGFARRGPRRRTGGGCGRRPRVERDRAARRPPAA